VPSKRDYKAAYERRDERARAQGYRGYYDYRAHDNGRLPPDQPKLRGEALSRARGHRGAADLERSMRPGMLVFVEGSERNKDGTYKWVDIRTVDEQGRETTYRLRGAAATSSARLGRILEAGQAAGAVFTPVPSLDVSGLIEDDGDGLDEDMAELDFSDSDIPF
jgi:hypothetical protein